MFVTNGKEINYKQKGGLKVKGTEYILKTCEILKEAWNSQREVLDLAAKIISDTMVSGKTVYIFGCSHAGILAEEVFYRTGGLATVNPIQFPGFMLDTRPITMTSQLERLPGLGKILIDQYKLVKDDLLLIHSVSGRNTVPVEMALESRIRGTKTLCITSVEYSRSVTSRHESGKRLFEVCDLIIDNGGVPGDAVVSLPGLSERMGPTSTTVGCALLNSLLIETVELLISRGETPPVFMSANLDGGDQHNEKMFEQYKDQIKYT